MADTTAIKKNFIFFMGVAYIAAGVNHFWHPGFYINLLNGFLPYPDILVIISGVAEILCGIGLLIPATRKAAAWGTVALLFAVSPVHINMVLHLNQWPISPVLLYGRIAVQFVLIWLAYIYTKD